MVREILDAIISELQIKQCLRDIARFWAFRSTVPGPGLRQASEFLCRRHREHGIAAQVIPYPADDRTEWLGGHKSSLEWVPRSARLALVKPEDRAGVICSYAEEPLSLISNSTSTPADGVEAPVVVMHPGAEEAEYQDVDVAGKIILTYVNGFLVEEQALLHGAIGVISDGVCPPWLADHPPAREPEDVPDLTMWNTFHGRRKERGLWGFSLSPRQGRRLRQIIRESQEPVVLYAEVDAELVEGTSEVVDALLPGGDLAHEEVWVLAHSSEPGARDNASGCCLAVEIARALKALTGQGALPPLRRSIRFLSGVEVEGYLPYIGARLDELDRVVAGLCLDSVGQDVRVCGGETVLFQSPETDPSFVDGLLEHLFSIVAAEPNGRFSADNYDIFPWRTQRYWGNDAFVSEGFFDIPAPQVSGWPDKFYHSALDTPGQMSENALGRVGAIAATYLYLLATAGTREALWFAGLAAQDWKRRICDALSADMRPREALDGRAVPFDEQVSRLRALGRHMGCQARDAVEQVLRLAPSGQPRYAYRGEPDRMAAQIAGNRALSHAQPRSQQASADGVLVETICRMSDALQRFAARESEEMVALAAALAGQVAPPTPEALAPGSPAPCWPQVFKRLRWKKPTDDRFSEDGQARLRALRARCAGVDRVWDWINGRRTVGEIWERVQFGGAVPCEVVVAYLELLASEKLAI